MARDVPPAQSLSADLLSILLALLVAFVASPVAAMESLEDADLRILTELRSRSPAAADTFALANAARYANDHERAAALYHRVGEMVPDCSAALRREGYELLELGHRQGAIERIRQAVHLEASAHNNLALARALAFSSREEAPTTDEMAEAAGLIRRAAKQEPDDPDIANIACRIAIQTGNIRLLRMESERLVKLAPQDPAAHYFQAAYLAYNGDRKEARESIEAARDAGLPDELYVDFVRELDKHAATDRLARLGLLMAAGWLAGFLILFIVGSFLSAAALKASQRVPAEETGRAGGLDAGLRTAYRWLLLVSCVYYYVSIPFVLCLVLGVGGGLIYGMLMVGHIPVKLLAIVLVVMLVSLYAILKSLLARGGDDDPGRKADPEDNPRLRRVLDDVAARIGTRPVTNVYMTPGTEIAVMERGGILKQMNGRSERCLILGIGALDGMKMRPFRAILAHEYGHFSNRDTAGGGFALAVRRSLVTTAIHLAQEGAAGWFNPAWWFVNGYYRLFLRVSHGASRLQEVLADRWAAFAYGSAAFKEGLRHVIDRSIRFDAHTNAVLTEVIDGKKALPNLYAYRPVPGEYDEENCVDALEKAIHQKPSPYDSHPRPADRFAWVEALGTNGGPAEPDDRLEAWSLFDNREFLEKLFTDQVRRSLRGRGIVIEGEGLNAVIPTRT